MRRVRAVARKEFLHLVRDPRSLAAALVLPVLLLLLYGFAVNFDLKELRFAVVDDDRSEASERLAESLAQVPSFHFVGMLPSATGADGLFQRKLARAVLVVPPGFERELLAGRVAQVQVLLDGSEASTASIAQGYTLGAISRVAEDLVTRQARARGLPVSLLQPALDVRTRVLFNPNLESRLFLVPGLIAVILMVLTGLLTSGVVVREKERGTFELLAASPVSAPELLIGKLLPYLALAAFDVTLAVGLGWAVFGVVPQGSLLLLFALSFIYVLAALSLGLLFSCIAPTQQTAMLLAFVGTVLPAMVLSGFAFPVRNMPWPLQALAQVLPATHYIVIARGIILKGVGLQPLLPHVLALLLITAVLMRIAVKRFRKTL